MKKKMDQNAYKMVVGRPWPQDRFRDFFISLFKTEKQQHRYGISCLIPSLEEVIYRVVLQAEFTWKSFLHVIMYNTQRVHIL